MAQETFIKAYTSLRLFKGLSSFSTWIFRIAYNVFYDFMRSRECSEEIVRMFWIRIMNFLLKH
ncbi:MAG: sigma factor [Coprobacter fastidiosus]